ncbi:selenite/tellurite reduction operon porin ExtI [Methylosoma difficile]
MLASATSVAHAGATFKIDDTKWVSVGAGLRSSFNANEKGAPNGTDTSTNFNLDNIRLYVSGQIHKYIKIEFNTDCQTCNSGGEVRVLDAIGKFEINPYVNLWVGRMLVPAERREMNGPFYSANYNIFANGTPFIPADQNLTVQSDGSSAGSYGRDDGATFWGAAVDGRLQYAVGFFRGLRSTTTTAGVPQGANQDGNVLFAQRVAYNFWEVEKNPGYYTSGTYYGTGGDIFTIAASNIYQEQGVGTAANPGNFRGTSFDVLVEKILPGNGVVTLNGEYKNFGVDGNTAPLPTSLGPNSFTLFQGNAYDVSAMYLFPQKIGYGKIQPYGRYVNNMAIHSPDKDVFEGGLNYIIDGHNARISLSYQRYLPTDLNGMTLGFQWQI